MATALSNLLALLALDNKAYLDGLGQSQAAADTFGSKLSTVGGSVVMGALTAAAVATVAVGTAAWDAAETIDDAYDTIAIGTGATGEALQGLQSDFKAVFTAIPTDSRNAADAISILNSRLNITGDDLQNLAIPLLEVTRLLGGDLTTNAELFTRVIGDWNIPVENSASSLDALYVASQATGANLDTLMQQVVQYGAPMRNFGFSFNEATALLASFAAQGVNTEIVLSGLRIAQGKFITQGKDMSTGLWDTITAIQNAEDATSALAIATEVFGAKAAGDMVDTIRAGKFDIDALTASMEGADGAIMAQSDSVIGLVEKWEMFKNKITTILAPIGQTMEQSMSGVMDDLTEIFSRPEVQASLTTLVTAIGTGIAQAVMYIPALIEGIGSFITFIQANEGILVGVFVALGVAALAWGVTTAAAAITAITPMLPVIGVILLIAAAAYLLYQAWITNFGGIQEKTTAVFAWLKAAFQSVVSAINAIWSNPIIQQVWQTILSNIQAIWGAFKSVFTGDWYAFGQNLRVIWDNGLRTLALIFQTIIPTILGAARNLIASLVEAFRNINWSEVGTNIIRGIAGGITGGIGIITSAAKNAASAALQAAKGFLGIQSPSKVFELQVGYMMAAGVAEGWTNGLDRLMQPAFGGLSPVGVSAQPAAAGMSAMGGAGTGTGSDAMMLEEIRRMLRELPDDIARAVASATAKQAQRF